MAELPVHLSQQSLQGAWQGTCWSGMPGSCALAWPAFFQACLGPSPARGYSTLQARSAFFQPQGNGSSTKVGTSFPSLPLPSVGAFQPFATSIPPVLDRGWGQNKPDFSCLPAHLFPAPRWMDNLLAVNRSRDWCGRFLPLPRAGPIPPHCN